MSLKGLLIIRPGLNISYGSPQNAIAVSTHTNFWGLQMENFILIDNGQLCFLKAVPTLEQAEYWADILAPTSDFYVTDAVSNKSFSIYTHYELRMLYYNTVGELVSDNMDYSKLLAGVKKLAEDLLVDETSLEDLKTKLGHERVEPEISAETVEQESKPRKRSDSPSKPITRPKEGSMTGKVWDIADQLHTEKGEIPPRQDVIALCTEQGINASTASTQYGKWKKVLNSQ